MKSSKNILYLCLCLVSGPAIAQNYSLDFTDYGWKNSKTGGASEFQTNGSSSGNYAGWDAPQVISNLGGSGVGASMSLSHQPFAWNLTARPALSPYFPNASGSDGGVLRIWSNEANIPAGVMPSVTLTFDQSVLLGQLALEGFREDDAWMVQAYDANGSLVTPLWRNANLITNTMPGDALGNTAINLLTTEGAIGAEAMSAAKYVAEQKAFFVWNANNLYDRGAAVIDYNGAEVKSVVYSMIEVDTANGNPVGTPADTSMYIGGGINFQVVPEPSSAALLGLGGMVLLIRRRR